MSSSEMVKGLYYNEINMPIYLIPVVKEGFIVWTDIYKCQKDDVIEEELGKLYDKEFSRLKMYVDEFNLTYLCYKDTKTLIDVCKEPYDINYGLCSELREKLTEWTNELEVFLDKIHSIYIEIEKITSKELNI